MILPLFSWGGARPCAVPLRVLSSVSFLPGPVSYNTIAVTSEMDVRGTSDLDVRGTPHRSEAVYSPPTHPEPDTPVAVSPHFPTECEECHSTHNRTRRAVGGVHRLSSRPPSRSRTSFSDPGPGADFTLQYRARLPAHAAPHCTHTRSHHITQSVSQRLHVATFTLFRHRKHTFPHSGQSQLCNPIPCFEPASATGRRGEHFHARQTIPCFEPASTTGRRIAPMKAHRVTGPARQ